jgi:hypothetical protein
MGDSRGYSFDESIQVVILDEPIEADLDAAIALSKRLAEDPHLPVYAGFLVDLRPMTRLFQFDEIYQLIDWHKTRGFPFKGRVAFLVDRPATVGTANIFCSLLQLHALEAEIFDSEELAKTWLSGLARTSGAFIRGSKTRIEAEELVGVDVAAVGR